jgi:GrpB-like predicted nucleotidyltransferase (UPF0157 family)
MIEVVGYDQRWPAIFNALKASIWPAVAEIAKAIEHVGSTAVPGLAAKPVIDVDVVATASVLPEVIARLEAIGYVHLGDLGVTEREAFRAPEHSPRHNLYAVVESSVSLRNHLAVRDYLRTHPDVAKSYGSLKRHLAALHPDDVDAYVAGKSDEIARILAAAGLTLDEIASIYAANTQS